MDHDTVLRWQNRIGHMAPATRRAYTCTVRMFCSWLAGEGHIPDAQARHFVKVREPRRTPRALRQQEVDALLGQCLDDRHRLMVWLMLGLGLRCVEVSRLNIEDYDEDSRTLFVRGKAGHERVLPVPDMVADAMEVYLRFHRRARSGALFPSSRTRTGRMSAAGASELLSRLMRLSGVHRPGDGKSAHALRHTCASDVLDVCRDLRVVQQMLGHESLATTQIYLRRADLGRLREAMEGRTYLAAAGAR